MLWETCECHRELSLPSPWCRSAPAPKTGSGELLLGASAPRRRFTHSLVVSWIVKCFSSPVTLHSSHSDNWPVGFAPIVEVKVATSSISASVGPSWLAVRPDESFSVAARSVDNLPFNCVKSEVVSAFKPFDRKDCNVGRSMFETRL